MSRRNVPSPLARPVRSATVIAAGIALLSCTLVGPAWADEEIVIRPTTVIYGDPGSVHNVGRQQVAADLVGKPCDLRVKTQNNSSIHPGTVAIVTTGSSRTVVPGIEDSSEAAVLTTTRVELGRDIVIDVQLGKDGSTSLGFTAGFECSPDSLLPPVLPARQLAPPITEATTTTAPPTSTPPPSVLPAQQTRPDLPQAAPAKASVRTPTFTG